MIRERVEELRRQLEYHNFRYYVENAPEISDFEFDAMMRELQDAVKEKYPLGFTEAMMRVDKPNGDFFYAVPFDTDEIAYMVKIDVKIDDNAQEEDDKDYYDDEIKGADEIQDDANSDDGGGDSDDDVNI